MNPSVYLYSEKEDEFELYLGEFSTFEGLSLVDPNVCADLVSIGASCYKNYGWATEREFPRWNTVKEVTTFLKNNENIGLIDFEIRLDQIGYLSTHDDGECHFRFKNKSDLIQVLKSVIPNEYSNLIISLLFENPDKYIEIDKSGKLKKYPTFDQYLKTKKLKI